MPSRLSSFYEYFPVTNTIKDSYRNRKKNNHCEYEQKKQSKSRKPTIHKSPIDAFRLIMMFMISFFSSVLKEI